MTRRVRFYTPMWAHTLPFSKNENTEDAIMEACVCLSAFVMRILQASSANPEQFPPGDALIGRERSTLPMQHETWPQGQRFHSDEGF